MWWAGTEVRRLEVFLSRHGWSACRGGALLHAESGLAESDVLASLVAGLAREEGGRCWNPRRVEIYLSGALCRPFLLPELPPLSRGEQLLAINAAARKRTGFPDDLQVWLSPVLEDEKLEGRSHQLGAAMPANLLRSVVSSIKRASGLKLGSVQPVWSLALRVALASDEVVSPTPDMLLVRDCDSVTLFASTAGDSANGGTKAGRGFAAAITVEASQEAGIQRSAILRLVSGLEMEPERSHQFLVDSHPYDISSQPTASATAAANSGDPLTLPLADLWTVEPFDLATV